MICAMMCCDVMCDVCMYVCLCVMCLCVMCLCVRAESIKGVSTALKGKYLHWTGSEADEKATMVFEQWRVNT